MPTEQKQLGIWVVEDEAPARRLLCGYVEQTKGLVLAGQAASALECLQQWDADEGNQVMFLDIQLGRDSGIELLRELPQRPVVVFATAYAEHAVEAFGLDAVDYLLKPIPYARFLEAVRRCRLRLQSKRQAPRRIGEALEPVFIKEGDALVRVEPMSIARVEAYGEYIRFWPLSVSL